MSDSNGYSQAALARALRRAQVIISFGDGGQVRRIATRAQHKPTGRFTSLKCGKSWEWEAEHERHLMWISEADPEVIDYVAQPAKLTFLSKVFASGARKRRNPTYIPDLMRRLANGTIEIIETKKTREEVDGPFYEAKLERAREAFREKGFRFRIMTARDDIDVEPLLSNARMIRADRYTELDSEDRIRAGSLLDRPRAATYGEIVKELTRRGLLNPVLAKAKLHAMIVRREAALDIAAKITPDTRVTRPRTYSHVPVRRKGEAA